MTRKIILTYENQYNEKKSKTISFVSTTASNSALLNFSRDLIVNLTNNTLISTDKVDTTNLDNSGV